MILPRDLLTIFQVFLASGSLHRIKGGHILIWHTMI